MVREGDVLTVEPAKPGDLRMGDIALHRLCDGQLVAHRVVGRAVEDGQPVLRTRGDAGLGAADRVREADVLGRVVERERDGRVVCIGRGLRRAVGRPWVVLLALRRAFARLAGAARRLAAWPFRRA